MRKSKPAAVGDTAGTCDEWQRLSKSVGDGLNGGTLKSGSPLQRVRQVDRATVSSARE